MTLFTVRTRLHYLLKGTAVCMFLPCGVLNATLPASSPLNISIPPEQMAGESGIFAIGESPGGQIIVGGERVGYYENNLWQFLPTPRSQAIRPLLIEGDSLWVASLNEIGRFQLPLSRSSIYEPIPVPDLGEIWGLALQDGYLIAAATAKVWIIDLRTHERTSHPLPNESRLSITHLGGRLIVAQPGVALWEIKGGQIMPFENPLPDANDNLWLWTDANSIVTAHGIYRIAAGKYVLTADLQKLNHENTITDVSTWAGKIAIATNNAGLVTLDRTSGQIDYIVHPANSPPGRLWCAFEDHLGRLWLGTKRGIVLYEAPRFGAQIILKEPPLSAARADGLLINYGNHAEYYHSEAPTESIGDIFTLKNTGLGLAIGLYNQVQIGNKRFPTPGNRVGAITELPNGDVLAAVSERMYLISHDEQRVTPITGFDANVSNLAALGDTLWVAAVDRTLQRSPATPPFVFTRSGELPEAPNRGIFRVGDKMVFASRNRLRYGAGFDQVQNTEGLSNLLLAEADGSLWLTGQQDGVQRLGRVQLSGQRLSWETVEAKGLASFSEVRDLSARDGLLTLSGDTSLLELNTHELKPAYHLESPQLIFSFPDGKGARPATGSRPPTEISADENRVTFTGSLSFDEFGEKPVYERRLRPNEVNWILTNPDKLVTYPALLPRSYTLEVRTRHLGRIGPITAYPFVVLPPWYFSRWAFATYSLLAIILGYLSYRLRTAQILRRNQELERLIQERTHELAKASAAKTEFLASMSHEIRNPMNGVIGLVNILREQNGESPRQAHMLKMLHHCAEQLRTTVDDILDFSKIEAGQLSLGKVPFNLRDTLQAAAATIDLSGATIKFVDQPPADLMLEGDPAKLRQIFANYLSNALKYGVPPQARVSTILTPSANGVQLTLSVTSPGPTIAKDTLDKFFESFTRGDEAKERNIRGTGLGLAICQRYARAMGGEVGAVSTNGETTFYLTVPFVQLSASALAAPIPPLLSSLPARALAIEDEDYNRIVLGSILAKMNYSVDWATTGKEALRLARENGYDIVLTDYRLPDTNGVDLTKEILRICPEPKPAVFAVTAYSTRERRAECLAAGMSGFISKPITLDKFRATLAGWGEKNLARLSLETSRPSPSALPATAIENNWTELKLAIRTNPKQAAALAHRLNNLCRSLDYFDLADQLELLEGALERGEPVDKLVKAFERLLRPTAVGQSS